MNITFFGGAMNDTTTTQYQETILIGKYLADKNYNIKSGGYRGLMEAISYGASLSENKVKIIGYTCKSFGYTKGNKYLTETIICDNIFDRLNYLITDSSAYIFQIGSIGMLSELFLTLDIYRKIDNKPKIILIGDFWKPIIESLKIIVSEKELNLLTIVSNYNELIKII
jgi:hypothetical protein